MSVETSSFTVIDPVSSSDDSSAPTPAFVSRFGRTGVTSLNDSWADDSSPSKPLPAPPSRCDRLGRRTPQLKLSMLSP